MKIDNIQILELEEFSFVLLYYEGNSNQYYEDDVNLNLSLHKKSDFFDNFLKIKSFFWDTFHLSYQIFRPELMFSQEHIKFIIHYLSLANSTNSFISNDLSMEFLLYLSGSRQIKTALKTAGINPPKNDEERFYMGEILFGNYSDLQKGIESSLKPLSMGNRKKFKFLSSSKWDHFLKNNNISMEQIINIIKSYSIEISKLKTSNKTISIEKILEVIPEKGVKNVIVDALVRNMVELYINNNKTGLDDIKCKY